MLFLCQLFYPDYQATSQVFSDLMFELARRGQQIHVFCGWPLASPNALAVGVPRAENYRGLRIQRVGFRVNFKQNLFLRGVGYLSYLAGTMRYLLLHEGSSLTIGCTNPPLIPALVWFASCFRRQQYVLFLHDVYPDGLVALGKLKRSGLLDRFWTALNRRAFQKAKRVLVLGRDMAALVERQYGCRPEAVRYIPHWSQNELSPPARPEETRLWSRLGLNGNFVVQYSGNMGLWHDMKCLVRAAHRLLEYKHIQFLFIGDGRRKSEARALAEELGVTNIAWLPYQPKETLNDSLACCHLALISQREGLQGVAVPCKLYGILASGRAVIGLVPCDSETALAIGEERCGLVLKPDDDLGLAGAILELSKKGEQVQEMGERARRAYQQKYTLERAVERFTQAISGLEGGGISDRG